jgi:hypothetical protein
MRFRLSLDWKVLQTGWQKPFIYADGIFLVSKGALDVGLPIGFLTSQGEG